MNIYLGNFIDKIDLEVEFDLPKGHLDDCSIIFAVYSVDGYEGSSFTVFIKDNTLYSVFGTHCSCYGLENQWDPEKVNMVEVVDNISNFPEYKKEMINAITFINLWEMKRKGLL